MIGTKNSYKFKYIPGFLAAFAILVGTSFSPVFSLDSDEDSSKVLKDINKASSLLKKGDTEGAINIYKNVVAKLPDNAGVRQRLAKAYYGQGDIDAAVRELETAVSLKPQVAVYQIELAWLYTKVNRIAGAMRHAKIAKGLAPEVAAPYVILGYCYGTSDKYKLAYDALNKAIGIDPDNVTAYLYLAEVYQDEGKAKESIEAYNKALKIEPKSAEALLGLAGAYGLSGDAKKEKQAYEKVVGLYPNDPDVLGRYGWYLSSKGDIGNSLKYGMKTTMFRINQSWDRFMGMFIAVWAGIFIVFGVIFSAIALGANFKEQPGEKLLRSFFLIMYKEKPGRLVVTSRRIVFVPELISRSFGATRISIERDQLSNIIPGQTKSDTKFVFNTKSGADYPFKVPVMIQSPLLKLLKDENLPVGGEAVEQDEKSDQPAQSDTSKTAKEESIEEEASDETKEEEIVASLDFRPESDQSSKDGG